LTGNNNAAAGGAGQNDPLALLNGLLGRDEHSADVEERQVEDDGAELEDRHVEARQAADDAEDEE
ncbi:hypothetical protein K4K50_006482, partial [Colletotrichum sp. SAR 10_71]